jgi:hypothetical protein
MRYKPSKRNGRWQQFWPALTAGLALLVIIIVVIVGLMISQPAIPTSISKQASFPIFYPTKTTTLQPVRSTINYSKTNNGLSYTVLVNNKKIVVSEQATPDAFSQNGVYDYKLQQANQYDEFSTLAGQIDLTKPKELNGQTLAWLNGKGTLTLAHAYQTLTEAQWKLLFNNLSMY